MLTKPEVSVILSISWRGQFVICSKRSPTVGGSKAAPVKPVLILLILLSSGGICNTALSAVWTPPTIVTSYCATNRQKFWIITGFLSLPGDGKTNSTLAIKALKPPTMVPATRKSGKVAVIMALSEYPHMVAPPYAATSWLLCVCVTSLGTPVVAPIWKYAATSSRPQGSPKIRWSSGCSDMAAAKSTTPSASGVSGAETRTSVNLISVFIIQVLFAIYPIEDGAQAQLKCSHLMLWLI